MPCANLDWLVRHANTEWPELRCGYDEVGSVMDGGEPKGLVVARDVVARSA